MNPQFSNAISDPARLDELIRLRLLDSPPEAPFDRLTRLAARTLGAPISLVSLVDDHRQFFKSAYGLPEPWSTMRETPLSHSFCQHVVLRGVPLVVENAPDDPIVAGNPAISLLNLIAYLGVPLTTATGKTLGSFCVIAHHPVKWSACDRETMVELAASVMSEIALRFTHDELSQANAGLLQEAARREIAIGELRQSEARLRTAQRLARVGSFELRANASPGSYWSDEARRIMGLTGEPPDSVAQFVARHVHPDDRCRMESAVAQAFSSRETVEVEYRVNAPPGPARTLLTVIEPEEAQDGSMAAICTAVDITERYEAEAALAEYRNELYHVARVATVGEMATVMAHEINQPLAAISHTANACARLNANGSMDRNELLLHLNTISAEAKRASTIIQQLRSYVRKQPPTREPVDLGQVVDDVLSMVAPVMRQLGVKLSRAGPSRLPNVMGDEIQLGQLVLNLVRNSLDALGANLVGNRRLSIAMSSPLETHVVLEIADNGPGIDGDTRAKVFDPFFTTRQHGLGMGLPISKTIADTHGASLELCDAISGETGAMFRITLPAVCQ